MSQRGWVMSAPSGKKDVWVDGNLYNENFSKIPFEEITKYADQFVAVTLDGTRIIMADDDEARLADRVVAAGIGISDVVFSYIPPPDTVLL
jgi:hypothetical protein